MVVSYYLQCNHYSEKREKKSLFREKICCLPFHFVNKTRTKAYDISTMSIFSVVRYVLLLNQLTAVRLGVMLLVTVMTFELCCNNMKGSCTLA